ncbi:MAG: hypothetical protein OEM62_02330 [Acidobacteriota bacterium]|nr:hypothetical protein [Acidobacteriota bacterium]
MNRAQRVVLIVGLVLLLCEILFPPFKWSAGGRTFAAKHSFLLTPPAPLDLTIGTTPANVDTIRWISHGLTLIGVTALALLLFRSWEGGQIRQAPDEQEKS